MRQRILAFILILTLIIIAFGSFRQMKQANLPTTEYILENEKKILYVADTPSQKAKGLMNFRNLPSGIDGMIFIYSSPQTLSFWNKNTYMDLKVYWIRDKKVVGIGYLPSIEKTNTLTIIHSPGQVDTVIEIPSRN